MPVKRNDRTPENPKTYVVCGAKTKKGIPCQRPPVAGRKRCPVHGGKTPRGKDSPHYRGKGYSRYLPTELLDEYEKALADPDLVSHRQGIAMLSVRAAELVKRMHAGESGSLWADLQEAWQVLQMANQNARKYAQEAQFCKAQGDEQGEAKAESKREESSQSAASALSTIGKLVDEGAKDEAIWKELIGVIDKGSVLVAREQTRLQQLNQVMTAEQALLLLEAMYRAVCEAVPDKEAQQKVASCMDRILFHPRLNASQMHTLPVREGE